MRIAIDTGGTFTDLVARDDAGQVTRLKVPSTPDDPGRAVLDALAALGATGPVRHGTTVATNALLERRGARVVLITNAGFEDLLRLRRQARPDLYALHPVVPPPLVADVVGVEGRRGPRGEIVTALEDLAAWRARHHDRLAAADAFAVSMLHAYADGADERAVAETLRAGFPDRPVTVSSALAPVFREYERTSTAAVNAFLAPVMARYLDRLADALAPHPLAIMGSAGGLLAPRLAAEAPVHTVLSGPAGGVRGAYAVGRRIGRDALLTLDMGGTSTDVSVVHGAMAPEDDGELDGHPLRVPLLPIETVGAGGGSVAFVDDGGVLRVGPRSAGAAPGPACYGRGGVEPTVTDAHVVLGRLTKLLGGAFALDDEAARAAVAGLAGRLGAPVEETAAAIVAVAEANMARACKRVTMSRGVDPRRLALVAFGGAGGLHACALADELGCPEVIFPAEPGVLSAEGILDAPRTLTETRTVFWSDDDLAGLPALVAELERSLRARLPDADARDVLADCRYRGQTFTLAVPVQDPATQDPTTQDPTTQVRAAFDALHAERYGYALGADAPFELVSVRVTLRAGESLPAPTKGAPTPIATGPAAVDAYSATLWLPAGWEAERLSSGDLVCRRTDDAAPTQGPRRTALALEIHRQRLAAIAEEMGATLMRAAFSANIKERRDFSCAVFDAEGRMLVHAAHIPVHLGSTPLSVRAAIDAVPMRPGVQVLLNDPFTGGTHLPDVTLVTPVFVPADGAHGDDAPAFYVANRAHHADVGGISAGSLPAPRDLDGVGRRLTIDDEGFRLPPTPLDDALRARFAAASRTPADRRGDLRAQEAANRLGVERLQAWIADQGRGEVDRLGEALLDYAERRMRARLRDLPDGTWTFTDQLDGDGLHDAPIPLPVTLRIAGDRATVDFRAAPDSVDGPMNAVRAIALSAVFYCFRCLAGDAMPANAGLMRPIEVLTRSGSIVDAEPPAAVSSGNVETSQRLVDAVFGALAQAAPDRVPAASCGSMNNVLFGGRLADGAAFVHYETLGGGAGGGPDGPGADGVHVHMTNTLNTPIEALEHAFPVRIERYALAPARADAAPDEHAGGRGVVRRYRFLAPAEVSLVTERRTTRAWGVNGGAEGAPGVNRLIDADGRATPLPAKVSLRVRADQAIEVQTPGGGGWRPPRPSSQSARQSAGRSAEPNE